MDKILIIIPILLYLSAMLFIAYRVNKIKNTSESFTNEYYIGGRSMGGFVLAMTIVATYVGASSFIGGPGIAYKLGLGWVLLACIQVPTAFFTLGVLGKKLSIISRKLDAITIFEIFSSVVIIYTTFGGFRAVTLTDAIQAVVMFAATIVLFFVILRHGNGMENIMMKIKEIDPNLLKPDSGGDIAKPFIMSFWILVGIGILGLPATTIRCMAFKDAKAMHNAMIIGTSLVGVLVLGMHLVGVMGRAIIPDLQEVDKIIPILALKNLYPILAGVFIGGPLAAVMSTVDSLLIISSSTLIKDLYVTYLDKNASENKIKKISMWTSFLIGLLVFILSVKPISLITWINLFALGGQEIVFFCPLILGLYWKKANATGAIASIFFGIISYLYLEITKTKIFALHNIVPGLVVALTAFVIFSYLGKKSDEKTIKTFFEY